MNPFTFFRCLAAAAVLSLGFTACSTVKTAGPAGDDAAFASPGQLVAVYTNGDVHLAWKNYATAPGGNWVEVSTPGSEYTKLQVSLNEAPATEYVHPRVAPETQFIYHINPFFGQASKPVEITTGEAPQHPAGLEEGPLPADTNRIANTQKVSIRNLQTFAKATPTDLTATLSSPTSVDLRWTDIASDEDGYLVEWKTPDAGSFTVCALLLPDTTSFRKIELPAKTKCRFRVRPYFYGKPSETASVLTSPELKSPTGMQ